MIRSFAFTTQGRLHSKDIDMFLMPTLLADTNLFLWVDLENPTPAGNQIGPGRRFPFSSAFHRRLRDGQPVAESRGILPERRRPFRALSCSW